MVHFVEATSLGLLRTCLSLLGEKKREASEGEENMFVCTNKVKD